VRPEPWRDVLRSASKACVVGAAASVCAPWGCGETLTAPIAAAHGQDARPRPGGTLRLASFQDVRSLDPAGPTDGLAIQAQRLIFAGLVDYDEKGHVVPELAETWEVADGGRTVRFRLRPNVTMHDGSELTADDVKRSAERALAPATPNPNASYFDQIVGFEAFTARQKDHLEGVVVDNRYVVSFHLKRPDATFLPMLAMPTLRPVCRSAGALYDDRWTPCGAGPFRLPPAGWQRGMTLRLVRHGAYFRPGLPHLDAVEWTFNVPLLAQRFRFEAGRQDLLRDMTQPDQSRFAADPRWAPFGGVEANTRVYGEAMNTRMPPFDHIEIRRAVAAAIDREHYRLLKPAYLTVLTQLLPPDVPGYDPDVRGQGYDYPAALEHMRKAGYPYDPVTGKGGWPEPIVYPLYDQGLLVFTAQLLQQDLARIGLHLDLRLMSWPAFLALQERPGGAAISQANWEMDFPDPSSFYDPLFTTASIGPEVSYNVSFYSNPRLDELVARARTELDPSRRRALYGEADGILCDEAPWAFAFTYHGYYLRQPYVRDLESRLIGGGDPTRAWIDRESDTLERAVGRLLP